MAGTIVCPFCGFKGDGEWHIQLHIEEQHTEDSPFIITDSAPPLHKASSSKTASSGANSESEDNPWVKCTRQGCGEYVSIYDIDEHLAIHEAASRSEEESSGSTKERLSASSESKKERHSSSSRDSIVSRPPLRSPRKQQRPPRAGSTVSQRSQSILDYFTGSSSRGSEVRPRLPPRPRTIREPREPGRLGRRELGPHAYEKRMPDDVRWRLIQDAQPRNTNRIGRDGRLYEHTVVENETDGLIPVLAEVCAMDRSTVATYLCDPSVRHVVKIQCDGNFCGYWNIQMLMSHLRSQAPAQRNGEGAEPRLLPNVLQIQETIERAWDNGVCSYGRIETGGVRGTRKWIGSHETLAFFTQIGVEVEALTFQEEENDAASQPAVIALLDHIEAYFISALDTAQNYKTSHTTSLPPVYFQRFGHSMTIVGLERKENGSRNLLVFDPSFATASPMARLLAGKRTYAATKTLLEPYRRSDASLSRWEEFEIIVPKVSSTESSQGKQENGPVMR